MSAGRSAAGRRLRRDAEANREKILGVADRLFAERGLGVSHHEIAQAAGVAVGTVYRRFPDKSALVAALFTEQVGQVVEAAESALLVEDPWAAIVQFMTTVLEMQAGSRGLRELSAGDPHGQELARYARERVAPVVTALVGRGHAAGVLRPGVAEQDLALVPIMVGAVIQASRGTDPELWRRCLSIVLEGLRDGQPAPLPASAPSDEQIGRMLSR